MKMWQLLHRARRVRAPCAEASLAPSALARWTAAVTSTTWATGAAPTGAPLPRASSRA